MSKTTFFYPVTIKETYLDSFGHVNHAAYLTLFEEARWEIITQNGFGMNKIKETAIGPTILQLQIYFLKELWPRDEITIETQLISYEKKIGKISQKMLRDSEICCTAEFTIGLFDLKTRKLILPTPEWLCALGHEGTDP